MHSVSSEPETDKILLNPAGDNNKDFEQWRGNENCPWG